MLSPEQFQDLPDVERRQKEAQLQALQRDLQEFVRKMPQWSTRHGSDCASSIAKSPASPSIKASCDKGVLEITMPAPKELAPKKVSVKTERGK
jgi:hypothetical protein